MQELLAKMKGRHVELLCVGAVRLCGEILKATDGVLQFKDEDKTFFVAIDKIISITERDDKQEHRAGFIGG